MCWEKKEKEFSLNPQIWRISVRTCSSKQQLPSSSRGQQRRWWTELNRQRRLRPEPPKELSENHQRNNQRGTIREEPHANDAVVLGSCCRWRYSTGITWVWGVDSVLLVRWQNDWGRGLDPMMHFCFIAIKYSYAAWSHSERGSSGVCWSCECVRECVCVRVIHWCVYKFTPPAADDLCLLSFQSAIVEPPFKGSDVGGR